MMANSFGRYGHKYTKRKQYLAFLQFKNTAVHDCASWPDRPGCAWDCLRQIIGNLTQNLQLWGSDMFLVASHEHSTEKSSSLNTILPFLWVAGDPLWSLVTVLGFCKILEYGTPAVCFWCSFSRFPTGIWFSSLFLAGHFFFVYCTKNSTCLFCHSSSTPCFSNKQHGRFLRLNLKFCPNLENFFCLPWLLGFSKSQIRVSEVFKLGVIPCSHISSKILIAYSASIAPAADNSLHESKHFCMVNAARRVLYDISRGTILYNNKNIILILFK